jgi:hypothetical protein
MKDKIVSVFALFLFVSTQTMAHQPVMDMAPRWAKGYGFQTRFESFNKTVLRQGGSDISNPLGLKDERSTLWLEGVYTFTREHRISFKLPYILAQVRKENDGQAQTLSDAGLGDVIVGFLKKWYFNHTGLTGNLSFTPSLRLPTGKQDSDLNLGRGVVDYGLSVSASVEAYKWYTMFDVFTWIHSTQSSSLKPGQLYGFDFDIGYHPYHNMDTNSGVFVMTGINGRHRLKDVDSDGAKANTGGRTLELSPTLVVYKGRLMARAQVHVPVYSKFNGAQLAPTNGFQLGIGIVY